MFYVCTNRLYNCLPFVFPISVDYYTIPLIANRKILVFSREGVYVQAITFSENSRASITNFQSKKGVVGNINPQ